MKDLFDKAETKAIIERINQLTPTTEGLWGKMTVAQMLAHCNVAYEMAYENIHEKPGGFKKMMLKLFVKKSVVGPKPYKRNLPTAPAFKIEDSKNFKEEKRRLIDYLNKTQALGGTHFHNKESHSFGPLTKEEWNVLFSKHLNHHLEQFGV